MSDSLWLHESQHARPPCPSPTPGVYSNSSPLSRWCHPTISCSVVPFSSCLQSFPASGFFPVSQFFASCGQTIGASVSASVLSMNIQDCFPLQWTGRVSLLSKGLSRVLQHHSSKASILWHSGFFIVQLSHLYMTTGKTIVVNLASGEFVKDNALWLLRLNYEKARASAWLSLQWLIPSGSWINRYEACRLEGLHKTIKQR